MESASARERLSWGERVGRGAEAAGGRHGGRGAGRRWREGVVGYLRLQGAELVGGGQRQWLGEQVGGKLLDPSSLPAPTVPCHRFPSSVVGGEGWADKFKMIL